MARKFAQELSHIGVVVVSGMALGIDAEAHYSCIRNGGKTIAVLHCGFDHIYLPDNVPLFKEILDTEGLIISEYPPASMSGYQKYIQRNRIVSGLSLATIVIEAGYRSGTGITARLTKEQGKPVFCVPSNLESKYGLGTNKLIQNGAYLLTNIKEIIDRIDVLKSTAYKLKPSRVKVDNEFLKVYEQISKNPIDINTIYKKIGGNISDLTFQLTMLEIDGYIKQLPNGFYIIC